MSPGRRRSEQLLSLALRRQLCRLAQRVTKSSSNPCSARSRRGQSGSLLASLGFDLISLGHYLHCLQDPAGVGAFGWFRLLVASFCCCRGSWCVVLC